MDRAQVKLEAYLWKQGDPLGTIAAGQVKNNVGLIGPKWEQWQW